MNPRILTASIAGSGGAGARGIWREWNGMEAIMAGRTIFAYFIE